jgi:hypothetical protein
VKSGSKNSGIREKIILGNSLAFRNEWLRPWESPSKQNNEEATAPCPALGHG